MKRPESEYPNCTAHLALPLQVVAIVPALERFFDYVVAAFERLGGLEQG